MSLLYFPNSKMSMYCFYYQTEMSAILKSHNNIERKRQRTDLSLFFHTQEDISII